MIMRVHKLTVIIPARNCTVFSCHGLNQACIIIIIICTGCMVAAVGYVTILDRKNSEKLFKSNEVNDTWLLHGSGTRL